MNLSYHSSKKWWDKKFILKFGMESCDFTKSEVDKLYAESILQNKLDA